jgi:hypothetical protein
MCMKEGYVKYAVYEHFDSKGRLICRKCKIYKKESEFYKNSKTPGRHFKQSRCKECSDSVKKNYVKKVTTNLNLFLRLLWLGCKNRCKNQKKYKIFDEIMITPEYLKELYRKQESKCFLTGFKMTHQRGKGIKNKNISIDRINPKKGYIIGNVRLVCRHVNMMRSNLTDKELYKFCKEIVNNYGK